MRSYEDTAEHKKQRRKLVNGIRDKGIQNDRVLQATYNIPRHFFMPEELQQEAYANKAFPIGEGQTILQPYTVAYQTGLLNVQPTVRVGDWNR